MACDVDGVVWLAGRPLDGAADAVDLLGAAGFEVWFVTNNSSATHETLARRFRAAGIEPDDRLVTSADAAAALLAPGDSVLVGGEDGVREAVRTRGCDPVPIEDALSGADRERFDAVVVGIHRSFDYRGMAAMARHIRRGSRFVATNDDPTYPSPDGLLPGGGAIVAAVASAAGASPEVAGKPHPAMSDLLRARLGGVAPAWVIGDRASTDGRFAAALGSRFAHVTSDVGEAPGPGASVWADSLLDVARSIVSLG